MGTQTIDQLVEGGKASAAPPLGPALGPLGVNIGEVVAEINKATADFKGMQVPIKLVVDTDTKEFTITVGTPPASALVKAEAKIDKGSGNPLQDKVANIKIVQVIKIAKMKKDQLTGLDMFAKVKEICGTCHSMGVMVEGLSGQEAIKAVNDGQWKQEIEQEKSEITAEEMKQMEEEKKRLKEEMEQRREEYTATAKGIIDKLKNKSRSEIKSKLVEAKIPAPLIEELLPAEEAKKAEGEKK
jgi:large subunit ribosomal protein L11